MSSKRYSSSVIFLAVVVALSIADVAIAGDGRTTHTDEHLSLSEPPELVTLREFFTLPDKDIDLGEAKLLIDRVIDPSVNVSATLVQLDAIAAEIRAALPPGATSFDTAHYLRGYLYALGPWSEQTPFQYDLDDPSGTRFENKLLHHYLTTKKGNCISMPLLFIILGQRLGIEVTASEAPLHVFVKYYNPATDATYNIEATDRAIAADDDFYVEAMEISERAIKTGLYLQVLTKKETMALMMTLLCEHFARTEEWERCLAVAKVVLHHYPKCASAMIWTGNAYGQLMEQVRDRPSNRMPKSQKERIVYLFQQNQYWFDRADELGWTEPSQDQEAAYFASVRKRKNELD